MSLPTTRYRDKLSQQRWREHLRTVSRDDLEQGLSVKEWQVLEESDDSYKEGLIIDKHGKHYPYKLQVTPHIPTALALETKGLLYPVEYGGGSSIVGRNGIPLGAKTVTFAYSFIAVVLVQVRMKQRDYEDKEHKVDDEAILHASEKQMKEFIKKYQPWIDGLKYVGHERTT